MYDDASSEKFIHLIMGAGEGRGGVEFGLYTNFLL